MSFPYWTIFTSCCAQRAGAPSVTTLQSQQSIVEHNTQDSAPVQVFDNPGLVRTACEIGPPTLWHVPFGNSFALIAKFVLWYQSPCLK